MAKATAKLLIKTEGASESLKDVQALLKPLQSIENLLMNVARELGISTQQAQKNSSAFKQAAQNQKIAAQVAKTLKAEFDKTAQSAQKVKETTDKIKNSLTAINFNAILGIAKKSYDVFKKTSTVLWNCVDAYDQWSGGADETSQYIREIKGELEASQVVIGQIISLALADKVKAIKGQIDLVGGALYAAGVTVIRIQQFFRQTINAVEMLADVVLTGLNAPFEGLLLALGKALKLFSKMPLLSKDFKEQLTNTAEIMEGLAKIHIDGLQKDISDINKINKEATDNIKKLGEVILNRPRTLPTKEKDKGDSEDPAVKKHKESLDKMRKMDAAYRLEKMEADKLAIDELTEYQRRMMELNAEFISSMRSNIEGSLTDAVSNLFTTAIEGTDSWRDTLYGAFQSFAQNIFATSLNNIVKGVVEWAVNGGKAMAGIPVVGPVLAAATSAGILALMPLMKSRAGGKAQVSYANGGYISQGLVRGGIAGRDSVEAALMPGERVLSKTEAENYDKAQTKPPINVVVNITGGFDRATIDAQTRQYLIPAIHRAVQAGYAI